MKRPTDRLTAKEAAEEKGVHIKSLYKAISDGRLKAEQRIEGGTIMVRRKDLDEWKPRGHSSREGRKGGLTLAAA